MEYDEIFGTQAPALDLQAFRGAMDYEEIFGDGEHDGELVANKKHLREPLPWIDYSGDSDC